MCLLMLAGCFPTRSQEFACSVDKDCADGRACADGFCVVDDDSLNSEVDAQPIDAAVVVDAPVDARPCEGGTAHASDGGACLVFFAGKKTFAAAGQDCTNQSMHLANVKAAATNAVVQSMVVGNDVWLGATDAVTEGTFLWSDGTALTFRNFRSGEPNNGNGGEDCLVIEGGKGGSWDDRNCGLQFGYVCQFE